MFHTTCRDQNVTMQLKTRHNLSSIVISDTTNGLMITNLYAGGNCSFATCTSIKVPTQILTTQTIIVGGVIIPLTDHLSKTEMNPFLFPSQEVHQESNTDNVNNVAQHTIDDMIDRWTSTCDSKSWKKIKQ